MKTRMKTGMKSDANWWCMHVAGMRTGMKSDANWCMVHAVHACNRDEDGVSRDEDRDDC